ncbi:hypothetical protein [Gallaecimonas mangrovi]|uniref:hypothetical protein n=1 Tax=Gallaecimonas mangrovi TaxID=2291597 RepID=UPI000E1FF32B|nr:hypothetical protein [Gallaecimonas mangrovi]
MKWFSKKASTKQWGIALYQQSISLAAQSGQAQHFECQGPAQWPAVLAALPVGDKDQVRLVLPHSELSSLSVDKPPTEPITEGLFWALKDAVPIPPHDLQFDYYDLPAQPIGRERVNVVCASKALLKGVCQAIPAQVVSLANEEMTLRFLFPASDAGRPLLLLRLNGDGDLLLAIYHQGMLFFSRWLQGYRLMQDELDPYLLSERLTLDIQRAMDYLESQLRQPPVEKIILALNELLDESLAPLLAESFGLPAQSLADYLQIPDSPWAALAAARGSDEA